MALKDLILSGVPATLNFNVDIPSKGKLYPSFDPKAGITVSPITFQDELDMLEKRNEKGFKPIDFLLSRKMKGISLEQILPMDKFAVLIKLREVSYGNEYVVDAVCQKCEGENSLTFSLKDIPVNYLPDKFEEPLKITLPVNKAEVEVRLPRQSDFDLIGEESNIGNHLWRFIVSVNGVEDKAEIADLVSDPRFSLRDSKAILDAILSSDYGLQTVVNYECQACKSVNEARFALNADFFTFTT